ncbi:MAG: hypothetical protein U9N55_02410 [candidate division Zixibacteria bacterium]|nr:hypothetical protein [candidate division Zixibacteria bacterium]
MALSRKIVVLGIALLTFGLALIAVVNFTDACRLQGTNYNGKPLEHWFVKLGLDKTRSVVQQPVDSLARTILARDDIFRVDISYNLPHELDIRTNEFEPACFVVGQTTGKLFGLNSEGRLVRLNNQHIDWERPVFTGVNTGSLFSTCSDNRVRVVINELESLRRQRIDVYRLIDEVDFSNQQFLRVIVSGLTFHLRLHAQKLANDMQRFVEFVLLYNANLVDVEHIDLRYSNMIICAREDR